MISCKRFHIKAQKMPKQTGQKPEKTILTAQGGLEVELLNYGATLRSIRVPVGDALVDVLLTYPSDEDYLRDKFYLGATVGRYAGRIDSGVTQVQGRSIQLDCNEQNSGHCLHGGSTGFSHQFWSVHERASDSISYEYVSADGDQGFPGCLTTRVSYRLLGPNTLQIEFTAETDKETIINLSNHAYFNLNSVNRSVENHELYINSNQYTPLGTNSLPTGEIRQVADSVFDFRQTARLRERLKSSDSQLELARGYDHFYLLNKTTQESDMAAIVYSPESGIRMKLFTDQPGVQFYSANWLGEPFKPREGLCLEFQNVPNAPNMGGFPSAILKPGEVYQRKVILEFDSQSVL